MTLEIAEIEDAGTGSKARVLPGLGFNCYSFEASGGGPPVDVLWSAPRFTSGTERPTRSGIPILFPFAGRIRGTSFQYGGRSFPLEVGDDFGNAIHGFVLNRQWRVTTHERQRIVGEFQASLDDPTLLERWPADFLIRVTYEIGANRLRCTIRVENPDERPLPFTLGTHQYFRIPLGAGGQAADCRIQVPIEQQWELKGLVPTGRILPAEVGPKLTEGMPFGDTQLDDVFTGLTYSEGRATTSIYDPNSHRTMTMTFDEQFRHCVVFNPPHREAICIEPYTAAPNPFELEQHGFRSGLRTLAPGQSFEAKIDMRVH